MVDDLIPVELSSKADFCFLPANDCNHATISNISVRGLKKDARRFKVRNIRIRKPEDALRHKAFRANNNIPMGHRIY